VSQKLFFILVGLMLSTAAAIVLTMLEWSPWKVSLGCVGVIAFAAWWWHGELGRGVSYAEFSDSARRCMARAVTFAVLTHCVWVVWAISDTADWKNHAYRLLALAGLEWAVASMWEHRITKLVPPAPAPEPEQETAVEVFEPTLVDNDKPHLQTADQLMQAILLRGDWPYVLVESCLPLPGGHEGGSFECRTLSPRTASELTGDEVSKVRPLQVGDEEALATAVEEQLNIAMETRWVRIQGTSRPNRVRVTVAAEDILAKAHPYPLNNEMLPRGSRIEIGAQIHGEPVLLNPYQHGIICGATKSGKTSLVNVVIAELTRLPGRVWLCGAEKVYDIAGQWLDPHLGTDNPLPLDFVVEGQKDTLAMMAEAFSEARWRQNLPHADRDNLDPLWVVIEEAPRVLRDRRSTITFEGTEYSTSNFAGHATRSTNSAGVHWIFLAQEYDNPMFGDDAASIKENCGYTIIMKSKSGDERSRAFGRGGAALPNLYNSGEFYIQDGSDPYPAKARYIQETDVRLEKLHDGPTLTDVTLARSMLVRARSSGRTGPATAMYSGRPQTMTMEYREYLRAFGPAPFARPALEIAEYSAAEDVAATIARIRAQVEAAPQLHVVESTTVRQPMREFLVETLTNNPGGMSVDELLAAALDAGYENTSKSSVENALTTLRKSARIRSIDDPNGRRVHRAA
jgi:hypothetical protein